MPELQPENINLIGPLVPSYILVVNGYKIPHLSLTPADGSETMWNATVGGHCVCADYKELCRWAPFLAHSMAYASGLTTFGENSTTRNDYHIRVLQIEGSSE